MKSRFMCHWCSSVSVYLSPCGTAFCHLSCRKWLPHHHCINSYFIAESLGYVAAGSRFIKSVKSHLALYYHVTSLCYSFLVKLYLHIRYVLSVICTSLFSKYALLIYICRINIFLPKSSFIIHFDPEDGDGTLLWQIRTYLPDSMVSHSRRQYI